MEEKNFLNEFNNSYLGIKIREKYLKISEEKFNEIFKNEKKSFEEFNHDVKMGLLDRILPKEIYEKVIEANEYYFSDINELNSVLQKSKFDYSDLTGENIELLKKACEICKLNSLNIRLIEDNENVDFRDFPIDELNIFFGKISEKNIKNFSNIKKLNLSYVELDSISELLPLKNLIDLKIKVHEDDPEVNLSDIDKFSNLKKFSILNQTLTQEDFDKICSLNGLEDLEIGTSGKGGDHEINDYSSIFNLTNLNFDESRWNSFTTFCKEPVITNIEDFKKLITCKFFRKVKYVGKEPLPLDLFDYIKDFEIEILSPFVISKEFAEKYENGFPGKIRIINDCYKNYTVPELYVISEKMEEILDGMPNDFNDFEKVAYISKIIAETCFYDRTGCMSDEKCIDERVEITRSLKGAFIENKLVCRGYALTVKALLDELEIESKIVSGENHAWNQVKIDEKWYNLDVTWDLREIRAGEELSNFLLSDEEFYKVHEPNSVDKDIRKYMHDGNFDFKSYKDVEDEIQKCNESYDREKVKEFFASIPRNFTPTIEVVHDLVNSEDVTINQIQMNMEFMANVGSKIENKQEDRENNEQK